MADKGREQKLEYLLERAEITFRVKARQTRPDDLARTVGARLKRLGILSPKKSGELCIALNEALINALDYGCLELDSSQRPADLSSPDRYQHLKRLRLMDPHWGEREIVLNILVEAHRVCVRVQDPGPGRPRGITPSRGLTPNGRGILIMRRLMDRVIIRRQPSAVTLIKNRI